MEQCFGAINKLTDWLDKNEITITIKIRSARKNGMEGVQGQNLGKGVGANLPFAS